MLGKKFGLSRERKCTHIFVVEK